jgi:putative endonuclease
MSSNRDIGDTYEILAQEYLRKNKIKIVDTNFHSRFGEIDIIGLHNKETLIFVEVRYRRNALFGSPEESVSRSKQQKIIKTAQYYLSQHSKYQTYNIRFDMVAINGTDKQNINWLQNIIDVNQ